MRLAWPASHLNRVLLVGLPLAAVFALVTVGPDYRHHNPPATGAAPPAAIQQAAPTPTTLEASSRNNTRLADLATLGKAMTELGTAKGGYPSTKGGLQTLCTYEEFDVGCALKSTLPDIPGDPQGRNAGYFYVSDGKDFAIVAKWEGQGNPPSDYACPEAVQKLKANERIACIVGPV
jgi:hypothetical protein